MRFERNLIMTIGLCFVGLTTGQELFRGNAFEPTCGETTASVCRRNLNSIGENSLALACASRWSSRLWKDHDGDAPSVSPKTLSKRIAETFSSTRPDLQKSMLNSVVRSTVTHGQTRAKPKKSKNKLSANEIESLIPRTSPYNVWNGLVPLHSTRQDVEAKLGSPNLETATFGAYYRAPVRISINYVTQPCKTNHDWNVPYGTVERILVTIPSTTVLLKDLKVDLSKFDKVESHDPAMVFLYSSLHEGLMIETTTRLGYEEVTRIIYQPNDQDEVLRCFRRVDNAD